MKQTSNPDDSSAGSGMGSGGFAMMAMMMACCLGVLVIFAIIPVVGLPIGLGIGALGLGAMMWVHLKMMGGHGGHH